MPRTPIVARTLPALRKALDGLRARKATIGLVPTMAHADGHVSLVRLAQRRTSKVVVSIFVNPTQFAPAEDFGSYPRTWKSDVAKLTEAGVDLIWNPDAKVMYPEGFATKIPTGGPASRPRRSLAPAFLRRRRDSRRQAVHAGAAGRGVLRREGLPAAQGRDAHGAGPRSRRQGDRRSHGARTRRSRDVASRNPSISRRKTAPRRRCCIAR